MKIQSNKNIFHVKISKDVSNKSALFDVFSTALQFPSYFQNNWDSFEECLNDLSWLGDGIVLLSHESWRDNALSKDKTYSNILSDLDENAAMPIVIEGI